MPWACCVAGAGLGADVGRRLCIGGAYHGREDCPQKCPQNTPSEHEGEREMGQLQAIRMRYNQSHFSLLHRARGMV